MRFPRLLILSVATLTASAAPSARAGDPIVVTAVGDIMTGTTWPEPFLPPDDGEGMLDAVRESLGTGDIAFGNLEGPMLEGGTPVKCGKVQSLPRDGSPPAPRLCFEFRMDPLYAGRLRAAGFNALNIANNHIFDFGPEGVESTVAALESAGIQPVGGSRTARFFVRGRTVAVAGFSFSPPSPWSHSILDIPQAQDVVRELKAEHDIVVVSFHGGAEGKDALHVRDGEEIFAGKSRGDAAAFARAAIDAGADLVLGHGPHVPRAMALYRGKLIAYSLGNFLAYGQFNIKGLSGRSLILRVLLDPGTGDFLGGRIAPVALRDPGLPVPDPDGTAVRVIRELTIQDFGDGSGLVIDDGGCLIPAAGDAPGFGGTWKDPRRSVPARGDCEGCPP